MVPPDSPSVLELFAHGLYLAAMFVAQACCPFVMLLLALRAL